MVLTSIIIHVDNKNNSLLQCRHEAIMLQKLSIMLLSSVKKKSLIMLLRIAHYSQNYATIMPFYYCIRPFSLMFKLQIILNSLAGCCIRVFHFNVTALLE